MKKTLEELKKEFPEEYQELNKKLNAQGEGVIENMTETIFGYVMTETIFGYIHTVNEPIRKTLKCFLRLAFGAGELHELNTKITRDSWVRQKNNELLEKEQS